MQKIKKGLKWFYESNIWIGLLFLIVDIVTKNIIVAFRENIGSEGVVLIPNFLRISYLINNNVAFGKGFADPNANRIVFIVVALLVSIGIIVYLIKKWKVTRRLYKAIAFMVVAGALGNCIDRIFFSSEYLACTFRDVPPCAGVVDWIDFYGVWSFNFNIADCAVVIAAFMLIIILIVEAIKEAREKPKEEKKPVEKIKSKTEIETEELRKKDKEQNE